MATGRYINTPMTQRRISCRLTIADRFRRWALGRLREKPPLVSISGYNAPIHAGRR